MDKNEKARVEALRRRNKYNKPWDVIDTARGSETQTSGSNKISFPEPGQTPYSDADKW